MALKKEKVLSSVSIHFATEDLKDANGTVLVKAGDAKTTHVEFLTYISEDGVAVPGTHQRVTATEADMNAIPTLKNKLVDSVARITAKMQDAQAAAASATERAAKAEERAARQQERADRLAKQVEA